MKTASIATLLCIGLLGCAGAPYTMSEKAASLQAQMTQESALNVVREFLDTSGKNGKRLCYQAYHGGTERSKGTTWQRPVIDGARITYHVGGQHWSPTGVTGEVLKGTGVLHFQGKAASLAHTFNLQDISYINYFSRKAPWPSCQPTDVGNEVTIGLASMPPLHELFFIVPKDDVDRFMAAAKSLSPNARMTTHLRD